MIRSLAIALAAGALSALIIWPVYGANPAFVTAALVAGISTAGLLAAHALSTLPSGMSLQSRFATVVATAIAVILASVLAAVELMFVSNHDALLVLAMVLAAAVVALRAGRVASGTLVREVAEIRDVLRSVGEGARESRAQAHAARELAELAAQVNAMIEQLAAEEARRDAADSARRSLVASISHDLRTPMTSLRLMVDAIEDGLVEPEHLARYLEAMRTHVTALGALIDDLFELSRIEAGDIAWSIRQVELSQLVEEAVTAMRPEAEARGVAVQSELAPAPQSARGDAEKLQRVLFNLIRNAIDHTPADGSVTVRADRAGEWVRVEVADTGDGIPESERDHVFEPFMRGEASRPQGGAGLGLAISRAIVEAHGGRIWVGDSDVGTRVQFVIPA
jgi:signal transduction histidine kinase